MTYSSGQVQRKMHKGVLFIAAWCLVAYTDAFVSPGYGFSVKQYSSRQISSISSNLAKALPRPSIRPAIGALRCSATMAAGVTTKFAKWLEDNGARTACTVSAGANGRGLVAKSGIKAGDEACSIPIKLVMTKQTAQAAFGQKAADLDADTAIALQLIKEKAEGSASFYAPWIEMLPTRDTMDVPYFWQNEEKGWLSGSKVEQDNQDIMEALQDEFNELMQAGWDKVLPSGSFTFENYEWASCIVSSRSHSIAKHRDDDADSMVNIEGGVALAPLVDFPEHSTTEGGNVELVYEGMFREPRLRLSAGKVLSSGAPVAVNYGSSNSRLVFARGLADLKVVRGTYDLSFSVSPMDRYVHKLVGGHTKECPIIIRFRDDKEDILEMKGYSTDEIFTLDSEQDEFSDDTWDMLAYLRLVCISGRDAFLLESVFRNDVWDFMKLPVSRENEKLMLDTLIGYCEGALEGYISTDKEDALIQRDESKPLRARLAAAAKLGEKKALSKSLRLYLDDADALDSKEYYQERRLKDLKLDRPLDESEIVDPDMPIRPDAMEF